MVSPNINMAQFFDFGEAAIPDMTQDAIQSGTNVVQEK
jgi:hypothetical protein